MGRRTSGAAERTMSMYWNYCNENCEYIDNENMKCTADGRIVAANLTVHGGCVSFRSRHTVKCVKDRELEQREERSNKMPEAMVDFIRRRFMTRQ